MKKCPHCNCLNEDMAEHCEECDAKLPSYIESVQRVKPDYGENGRDRNSNTWMYIICLIFPFIGLILGIVQLSKGNDSDGKLLIIMSVVITIICALIMFFL